MKAKTVKRAQLTISRMVSGEENKIKAVILDGVVMRWVGIGWFNEGPPTAHQKRTLPRVVD